ncbi:MAG: RadC family protein [Nannocystaceae bacterium]
MDDLHNGLSRECESGEREPAQGSGLPGLPGPPGCLRPRERLFVFGSGALSDVELIALLVGGGHAMPRALTLLQKVGGLVGVGRAMAHELTACKGIGEASAAAICAGVELARRVSLLHEPVRASLSNPDAVARYARTSLRGATQEVFWVIGLDTRQRVCLVREVGRGSLAGVVVHPREVFRPLVRAGVHTSILVHNHPSSGELEPSNEDLEMTTRLCEVGLLLGIPVLDHLIVSDNGHCSLAQRGCLPESR